jgi:hypothetical protein
MKILANTPPKSKISFEEAKLLKTKQDKEEFMMWIAFLQAGVFEKGHNKLDDGYGVCCLGVGCIITIPEHKLITKFVEWSGKDRILGGVPKDQLFAPNWLKAINEDFQRRTGMSLSRLNDGKAFNHSDSLSHPEIADKLLEVYGHELE